MVSSAPARPARPPIFQHPWRLVITGVVLLVVLNLGILLFSQSDTRRQGRNYPNAIDTVSPGPGELIRVADTVTADLRNDLTGVLLLDGAEVPEDQTDRVAPLGELSFRPGPDKDLTKFSPGRTRRRSSTGSRARNARRSRAPTPGASAPALDASYGDEAKAWPDGRDAVAESTIRLERRRSLRP